MLVQVFGLKMCILKKMEWISAEFVLNKELISTFYSESPIADYFMYENSVDMCFQLGDLLTDDNMVDFIANFQVFNIDFFVE